MSERNRLPQGWARVELSEVVLPRLTCNPREKWERGTFRYIDIEALDNKRQVIAAPKELPAKSAPSRARMLVHKGDVLFSLVRPYLRNIAIVPDDLDGQIASTAFYVLRPGKGIDSRFLFYQLCQDSFIYSLPTYGNSPPAARDDEFLKMTCVVAPTNEQRRIVAKIEELFSHLDAGVAALERAKANLKRYRAAVLKAAVEGRLTAEWRAKHPDVEPASELLKRILAERRRKWEEEQLARYAARGQSPSKNWKEKYREPAKPDVANLPPLPDGWCWATLEQLIIRSEYGTSVRCTYKGGHEPVLRIPNIVDGELELSDIKYATRPLSLDYDSALQKGDLLMCRTNGSIKLVGKSALVRNNIFPLCGFASYLLRFRFVERTTLPEWVHLYLGSPWGRAFVEAHAASSAGQYNISLADIHPMPVPLPPMLEQQLLISRIDMVNSLCNHIELMVCKGLLRAGHLRMAILKRAFEGKLVPQDPNDEPASVLLERIREERRLSEGAKAKRAARKVKARKGKGAKAS